MDPRRVVVTAAAAGLALSDRGRSGTRTRTRTAEKNRTGEIRSGAPSSHMGSCVRRALDELCSISMCRVDRARKREPEVAR